MAYKIEAFGGPDAHPMGETTTPTAEEMKQVVDTLLDLITASGQTLRITVSTVREG